MKVRYCDYCGFPMPEGVKKKIHMHCQKKKERAIKQEYLKNKTKYSWGWDWLGHRVKIPIIKQEDK